LLDGAVLAEGPVVKSRRRRTDPIRRAHCCKSPRRASSTGTGRSSGRRNPLDRGCTPQNRPWRSRSHRSRRQ
jgi:hypothetical protein